MSVITLQKITADDDSIAKLKCYCYTTKYFYLTKVLTL